MSPPADPLRAADILRDLGTSTIGRDLHVHASCASTNDLAFDLAAAGARDGTVVLAETQERGRGRHGRTWHSPPGGGLWGSVVLRHPLPLEDRPYLTVLGAVAITETLRAEHGCLARIRWPNDVTIGGRKIAGVLVEIRDGPGTAGVAVLGFGLDVACDPATLPPDVAATATSLATVVGHPVPRAPLCAALLRALDRGWQRLRDGDRASLDAAWSAFSAVLGSRVRVRTAPDETVVGRVVELSARAGVTLALDRGGARTFRAERITALEPL